MDSKSGLGLISIIAGILIIAFQSVSLTGAVINASAIMSNTYFVLGLALIIGGVVLFVVKDTTLSEIEQYKSPPWQIWMDTTKILRAHGVDYKGRSKHERNYLQDMFERRIKPQPYSPDRRKSHH